jgi:uncharacterized membrane protein YphA (DoxX/SURF4 family)
MPRADEGRTVFESYCRENLGPLMLRLAVGLVGVGHGFLKIMRAGGTAWAAGLPTHWQLLIAWGEFTAGVAILAGFRCRWAAAALLALTAGQLAWQHGWETFRLPLGTLEPVLMVLLTGLALLFLGGGSLVLGGTAGAASAGPRPARKR